MNYYMIACILLGAHLNCYSVSKNISDKEIFMYPYTLPVLPYSYNALEPYIDARTMEIHHTKHHQSYIDNLNKALEGNAELQKLPLEQLLVSLDKVPAAIRTAIRNNGGGHYAHTLFWKIIEKPGQHEPSGALKQSIDKDFGSFDSFKQAFTKEAKSFFGSGWVWLCVNSTGHLIIVSMPGHDVPMGTGLAPIAVLDVWEHAYYLKYQNRRAEYVDNWWHVVNWASVEEIYHNLKKH